MTFDGKAFGAEIVLAVKAHVGDVVAPLLARLDAMEKRISNLPAPQNGKDADEDAVAARVSERMLGELDALRAAVNAVPEQQTIELPDIPKLIDEAIEARVGLEDMERSIKDVVRMVVAGIPASKDGKDGEPGPPGPAGKDAPVPTREQIVEAVLSMPDVLDDVVQQYLGANPPPAGKDGRDGVDGTPGEKGADGCDGVDVVDLLIDREGALVATLSNGRTKTLGPVVGRDGKNGHPGIAGKDGVDGFGFEDMSEELADDGRTIIRRYQRGDQVKEFRHTMAVVIDRGVYRAETTYKAGDGVTWAGSFWIAQEKTTEKPDSGKGWRLAVKRGRDGKNALEATPRPNQPIRVGVPVKAD